MKPEAQIAERFPTKAFRLGSVTYVPHYQSPAYYVGPGYPKHTDALWTETTLRAMGAKEVSEFLWHRPRLAKAA